MSRFKLEGTVQAETTDKPNQRATLFVRVERVDRDDAPSTRVAELVLRNKKLVPGKPVRFKLDFVLPDAPGRYIARVHADVDGDGRVSRGDYVSTQSYPLPPAGAPPLAIVIKPVR